MRCTNCGREVPTNAKVCGYCGHRLRADSPKAAPAGKSTPVVVLKEKKKPLPKWIWIAGTLVVIAVFVTLLLLLPRFRRLSPTMIDPAVEIQGFAVRPFDPVTDGNIPALKKMADEDKRVHLDAGQEVLINWGWCVATNELLEENMRHLTISFFVDGQLIPKESFYQVVESQNGYPCHLFKGVLSGLAVGTHEIKYLMTTDALVNDGETEYPVGEISSHIFTVYVTE